MSAVKSFVVEMNGARGVVESVAVRRFQPENWDDVCAGRERVEIDVNGRRLADYLTRPELECWFVVYRFREWLGVTGECYAQRGAALEAADRCPHRVVALVGTLPTGARYGAQGGAS